MKILITGARALISFDWAYKLKTQNQKSFIILTDSLSFPLGRFSKYCDLYLKTSSPRFQTQKYINELISIIEKYEIDLLIPTCEEVFYISRFKNLFPKKCFLFLDNFEKISNLHNKFNFIELIDEDQKIKKPKTFQIKNKEDLKKFIEKTENLENFILKPVFSRFGSEFIPNIDINSIDKYRYPLVAQQKLQGKEFCSYTIAISGKIIAHSCYSPKYRAGVGAGIYFEPINNPDIFKFCKDFLEKINYTGQIGFDFIVENDELIYPIEANPRGTSGLHLIEREFRLTEDLFQNSEILEKKNYKPKISQNPLQIKFAMILFFFKNIKNIRFFIKDFFKTADIYDSLNDKKLHFFQILSFFEIIFKSFKYKFNLKQASTIDIEWDGDEIK